MANQEEVEEGKSANRSIQSGFVHTYAYAHAHAQKISEMATKIDFRTYSVHT